MDIDKVVQSPAEYFTNPEQVTTEPELDHEQKIRILESWKVDSMRLLISAAENMPGDKHEQITADLQQINTLLTDLKEE